MPEITKKLAGGDRRSIGRAEEVVASVLSDHSLFDELFAAIFHTDPLVRMRAADALEKVTAELPELLVPYRPKLLELAATDTEQELRWHLAQMLPRVKWTSSERAQVVDLLDRYLQDRSAIVRVCALQALWELSTDDQTLRKRVLSAVRKACESESAALRARARKLLGT